MNLAPRVAIPLALLSAIALLHAQSGGPAQRPQGYLTPQQTRDVEKVVPPAPSAGDPRFEADMAIFRATRALQGSARWKIAQSDDNLSLTGQLLAFRCALHLDLTPQNAPKLALLLSRADSDAGAASNNIKFRYGHKRPFQVANGEVCVSPQTKSDLEKNPDYPSGHTTVSWDTSLILAEIFPDYADDILARARAYGQSRVVCGVHNLSAVQAGWMTADAVFAMQQASAAFRADLDAARSEVAALRSASKATPQGCDVEAEALSKSPY